MKIDKINILNINFIITKNRNKKIKMIKQLILNIDIYMKNGKIYSNVSLIFDSCLGEIEITSINDIYKDLDLNIKEELLTILSKKLSRSLKTHTAKICNDINLFSFIGN